MSGKKAPLVSVYVTNFNYGQFIEQSVDSLLSQTLNDIEILIIDDGSTDGSREIIEQWSGHPQVKIIYQQNKGLNITNNIAMRTCQGKYIMRLDADDYLVPNALEIMSDMLEADADLGLVFPDYYEVDINGEHLNLIRRHNFQKVSLLDQPAHGACTMIRRDFLMALNGYDERYSCQDGYELWIKFVSEYKVANVNEPLFYYRQHGENLTSNEGKILGTRQLIKENYIETKSIPIPTAIGIIPVRSAKVQSENLFETEIGGKKLLDLKIESALKARSLQKVVITSSDELVKEHIVTQYGDNNDVIFVERPIEYARFNESLVKTLELLLADEKIKLVNPDAIMVISMEFPFVGSREMDDAVNTLAIFDTDSVISVRPDGHIFFQHHGNGMQPILNQDKFTKLEREALFKSTGGVALMRTGTFLKEKKLICGRVGHIVIDQQAAMGVNTSFDLKLAKLIAQNEKMEVTV